MAINDCIADIMAESGLSKEDAARVLDKLDARAQRLQDRLGLNRDQALSQAMRELNDEAGAAAAVRQRNQLENLRKRVSRRSTIEENAKEAGGDGSPNLLDAVRAQISDINTPVRGGRSSAEAMARAWHNEYTSGLTNELDRSGLYKAAKSNKLQREWGRELYQLSMESAGEQSNPGVTKNQHAIAIADSVSKFMSLAKTNLNKAGAWIGDYAGYITRTAHNGDKIRRAGPDAWTSFFSSVLDHARTFEGVEDPQKMLRDAYDSFITGVHLNDSEGVGFKEPAFTGPANMAKRLSEGRVFHFKDADAWLDYQEKFGDGTLLEQVYNSLSRASRAQALMERWGTNPKAEFDTDIQYLQQKYLHTNTDSVDKLTQGINGLNNRFAYMTGEANQPFHRLFAKISSYVQTVDALCKLISLDESMSKLGSVMLTHFSAGATKAGELRYQGVPWPEAYSNFFTSIFRSYKGAEASQWADEVLAGMEGTNRDIISGFSADDSIPGTASKIANTYFRLNGLTGLLNRQKAGAEWAISRRAGMNFGKEYGALPAEMQRALHIYNISPREWDIMRQAPDHVQVNGREFLTPHAALHGDETSYASMLYDRGDLTDNSSQATTERRIDDARNGLAMKVHAWLHDTADRAVVTPGIAEKALMYQGNQPGTVIGEAARFIGQFKMWPLAAVRQMWGREIYGRPGDVAGKISGIANLVVGGLLTGYAISTLKDLVNGRTSQNILDPKQTLGVLLRSAIAGGTFGILGDYAFGEYGKLGHSVTEAALGPVLGSDAAAVWDIWNKIKGQATDAHPKEFKSDITKLLAEHIPFANIWWTKLGINYLFLHSLQETLNPGYLQRSEQSLRKKQGQNYYLSPSQTHLHTFGR